MGQTVGGASVYSQGPSGSFTPNIYSGGISPTGSAMNSPYGAAYSPNPIVNTPGIAAGSSPYVTGYAGGTTPIGSGGYADFKSYSPAGAAGGSSNHAYSPTGINNQFQSPAYSPTTPNYATNYGGSNVPIT